MPDSCDFHPLFVQLQQRYPGASLVTELVQIHQGELIVRATVQTGGTPLATAMAAANTIEQAEDQARQRLLKLLGILTDHYFVASPHSLQAQLLTSPLEQGNLAPLSPLPVATSTAPPDTPVTMPSPLRLPVSPVPPASQSYPANLPEPQIQAESADPMVERKPILNEPPLAAISPELTSARTDSDRSHSPQHDLAATSSVAPAGRKKSARPSHLPSSEPADAEPPADSLEVPTDLSELIALTDIEMQRIAWKRKDGQAHLLSTYGVKTRAELNESQLLEFLHFLRALPSRYDTA